MVTTTNGHAPMTELGRSGLLNYGGYIQDEHLRELQGDRWPKTVRVMQDHPIISGCLFAIEMLCRQVEWRIDPDPDAPPDDERVPFIEQCLFHDMEYTWPDTLSVILSMVPWGWALLETVFKLRQGDQADPTKASRYDDGRIGLRKLALRAQESRQRWEYDDHGGLVGMIQVAPPDYTGVLIPLARALLFRTTVAKDNPEGHALALDTPIPTPDGWTTQGDLAVGDRVFDERGDVRHVVALSETWTDRPTYRVRFNDGTAIVADANHQWPTLAYRTSGHGRVAWTRTTEEMATTLRLSGGATRYAIDKAAPLRYTPQHLPIDPYILGLWLGDGTTESASIAMHVDDAPPLVAELAAAGHTDVTVYQNGRAQSNGRNVRIRGGLQTQLRALGVLGNKHVPPSYLYGSVAQRTALLQGLMDSDGTVDQWGRCCFTNTNPNLAQAATELVRSLGETCTVAVKPSGPTRPTPAFNIKFTPTSLVPFRLARKTARLHVERARDLHYVVGIDAVAPVPVRCIEVDSPSHCYLAGTGMVPTHNSALRGAYEAWYYTTNLQRIEAIGIERDLAGIPVAEVPPELMGAVKTPDQQAVYDAIDGIVTRLKRDEQAGVIWPLAYDANGKELYRLRLMTSGGQRQVNTHERIEAYKTDMAASLLADFIRLGHEQAGSWALSSDKTNLFAVALGAWLDSIAAVINTQLIPRLLRVNGWPTALAPTLGHDDIEHVNLASLGAALAALADKGLIQYHPELEAWILRQAGAPEPPAPEAGDGDKQPGTPAPAVVDQAGATPETPASTPPARAAAEPAPITDGDIAATARWAQEVLSAEAAALVRGDG